jgi:sec-independent protein translocase protein TatC
MCLLYEIGIWAAQVFIRNTRAPEDIAAEKAAAEKTTGG